LVAVRPGEVVPSLVPASCASLFDVLGPDGRKPGVLVSIEPAFAMESAVAVWAQLVGTFSESGATLLDWLLASGDRVTSVSTAAPRP
jgi:hypothetical protein